MAEFKKRVFGENVPKDIQAEIKKLAGGGFKTQGGDGVEGGDLNPIFDPQQPSFEKYLGERTPMSRMWTAVSILPFKSQTPHGEKIRKDEDGSYYYYEFEAEDFVDKTPLDIKDEQAEIRVFTVNENNEENTYKDPLVSRFSLNKIQEIPQLNIKNEFLKPAAGITSVTSKTEGALGALQRTVIEFIVHNQDDFENIFLPFFLKPGSIVCADFGWSEVDLYDPMKFINNEDLEMSKFDNFLYGKPGKETGFLNRSENRGKIKTVMGNVVSYDASVTPEGSFQCSIEIVSRNASILDKELSDDNKLKFLFTNVINDMLVSVLVNQLGDFSDQGDFTKAGIDKVDTLKNLSYILDKSVDIQLDEDAQSFISELTSGNQMGIISDVGKNTGIFHQDINANHENVTGETTYITWGLFEDLFLNKFVVGLVSKDEADDLTPSSFKKPIIEDYSNKFDSREKFVRWDTDLNRIQTEELKPGESLPIFLLPDEWDSTYNTTKVIKPKASDLGVKNSEGNWYTKWCKEGNNPDYQGQAVIPFREVFISTQLIKDQFERSDNLNQALIGILDEISLKTAKIWNLKLAGDVNSNTKIHVQDVHFTPKVIKNEDILTFNVTDKTSIVNSMDLKYSTPKDGLASILAIGNLDAPTQIDQMVLGSLNYINVLNAPKGNTPTIVKSLPFQGVAKVELFDKVGAVDMEAFTNDLIPDTSNDTEFIGPGSLSVISSYTTYRDKIRKKINAEKDTPKKTFQTSRSGKFERNDIELVDSTRTFLLNRAKRKYFHQDGEANISPILPIELTLSVYGNDFLQIGDYFTVNYLPKYYRDRVFFQLYGIEHKIDVNGWSTTYSPAIMRVRPTEKESITGKVTLKELRVFSDSDVGAAETTIPAPALSFFRSTKFITDKETIQSYMTTQVPVDIDHKSLSERSKNILKFNAHTIMCRPYPSWKINTTDDDTEKRSRASGWISSKGTRNSLLLHASDLALSLAVRDVILKEGTLNLPLENGVSNSSVIETLTTGELTDFGGSEYLYTKFAGKGEKPRLILITSGFQPQQYTEVLTYRMANLTILEEQDYEQNDTLIFADNMYNAISNITKGWEYNELFTGQTDFKTAELSFTARRFTEQIQFVESMLFSLGTTEELNGEFGNKEIPLTRIKITLSQNEQPYQNIFIPTRYLKVNPESIAKEIIDRYFTYFEVIDPFVRNVYKGSGSLPTLSNNVEEEYELQD